MCIIKHIHIHAHNTIITIIIHDGTTNDTTNDNTNDNANTCYVCIYIYIYIYICIHSILVLLFVV